MMCAVALSETPESQIRAVARVAVEAAVTAGDLQRQVFHSSRRHAKVHHRDIKMEVDRQCERAIVEVIRSWFPEHRILAEEEGELDGGDDYLWIVDPLDGTVNFFHGLPQFCACVACCRAPSGAVPPNEARQLLDAGLTGVVYAPLLDELYVGVHNLGATLNGKPLRCAGAERLADTVVALSFGKTPASIDFMTRTAGRIARRARKVRSYGCAGLDIAFVAGGRLGAVLYQGIQLWDFAAAGIVLAEAGGCLDARQQADGTWNLVGAAAGVHAELLEVIRDA